eukprot:3138638-Alexandrium_andersonii.AAC.1
MRSVAVSRCPGCEDVELTGCLDVSLSSCLGAAVPGGPGWWAIGLSEFRGCRVLECQGAGAPEAHLLPPQRL